MLTPKQIFAELEKDNAPTPESDSTVSLENVMSKLDETTKKFNDFQETVNNAFEKQVDGIVEKISQITAHEDQGEDIAEETITNDEE